MELFGSNDWERPIYYSTTVSSENYLNLEDYMLREGLALRVAPVRYSNSNYLGKVETDEMYNKLMNEFDWGGMEDSRNLYG